MCRKLTVCSYESEVVSCNLLACNNKVLADCLRIGMLLEYTAAANPQLYAVVTDA